MSTNCSIRIEGVKEVKILKYWDGYPQGTLKWLEEFNKKFTESRGNDAPYKFAQLLRSSAFDAKAYELDESRDTGWGVYPSSAIVGAEYEYLLKADGSVTWKQGGL
jgi:hypothetical protein